VTTDPNSTGELSGNAWNRLRYTVLAPVYDAAVRRAFESARRRSFEILALRPGERVLVVGCGTGLDFPYVPPGVRLTAGDLTPAMVRRAQDRSEALGLVGADVRVLDAHRLDLPDGSFDAVVLHLLLAVVPDPVAAIREARRVLAPGGRVAVFDKFVADGERPSSARRAANVVARVIATDLTRELGPLLRAVGLTIVHNESAGPGGLFRVVLARPEGEG
jgi:phosphatidylethanolamine/phosphatidyl-N-methylethanolamine N-methyltransferase